MTFQTTREMSYANNDQTQAKATNLIEKLKEYLKIIMKDKTLFFTKGETVYIPDVHGDFVHLIITLHRHGILDKDLNLSKDFEYVFLGDFYDRAPDADVIDYWLNNQIKNKLNIYRLIGNHEMAFFERSPNGYPVIFPSQDSIKDIVNGFQITENLLKNIAEGNIIAAYIEKNIMYVHSYIMNDDFTELGLESNSNINTFAHTLNQRFKNLGKEAFETFCENKTKEEYNWKAIMKPFLDDSLFNIYKQKFDVSSSFIWRRTGLPILNIYPVEIDVEIPDDVYQIVGHTPVFSFALPRNEPINKPFAIQAKKGTGKIQFSDVGIGYYYKSDFERPEVVITKETTLLKH